MTKPLPLRAGALEMIFEPATLFLRQVRLGGVELIRGIYGAVRDRNWGTIPGRLANLEVDSRPDSFRLAFTVDCRRDDIHFVWQGEILGTPAGEVSFSFAGEARTAFLKNRIGLCVLHPLAHCAGQPCTVEHVDGQVESGVMPLLVSPHQPFKCLRALTHEALPGLHVEARFEGETFEMEDQRNWSDASFKTYSTPLELPFPVAIRPGEQVRHRVVIRVRAEPASNSNLYSQTASGVLSVRSNNPQGCQNVAGASWGQQGMTSGYHRQIPTHPEGMPEIGADQEQRSFQPAQLKVISANFSGCADLANYRTTLIPEPLSSPGQPLPAIGVCLAHHGQALAARELALLRRLRLGHLRTDLDLTTASWRDTLNRAVVESRQLETPLHLALHLGGDAPAELRALVREVATHAPRISRWLVFLQDRKATDQSCLAWAQPILAALGAEIPVAVGTDAYFAELNRQRLLGDFSGWNSFSLNPQVHAFDDLSLMENLEAQPHLVESAQQFSPRPVDISPITLRPRFNPDATSVVGGPDQAALPASVDPRQATLFGAAWTLGSLARLCPLAGVGSLTYYETTGWRGLLETGAGSPPASQFPSCPSQVFPLYFVFAALAGGCRVHPVQSTSPGVAALLVSDADGKARLLLANLRPKPREIHLHLPAPSVRVRLLGESVLSFAVAQPDEFLSAPMESMSLRAGRLLLTLQPYAIAWVDLS